MRRSSPDPETYELNKPGPSDYGSFEESAPIMADLNEEQEESPETDLGISIIAGSSKKGTHFMDGKRNIDFILVYEEKIHSSPVINKWTKKMESWRKKFMSNLVKAGLNMEEEVEEGSDKTTHFIKLSAPWHVLVHYAEELSFRAPLQAHPNPSINWSQRILKTLHIPNIMYETIPNKPLDYYTCIFKKSKVEKFLGSEKKDEYFTSTQRIRVVWEILQSVVYGKRRRGQIGIDRLLEDGVFTAAYPLHDGGYKRSHPHTPPPMLSQRQILWQYWARWSQWYKYQPLDHIREYFGEKIAIYFAWLGFYTGWLLPAAIVGLFVFIYGTLSLGYDHPTNEICLNGSEYKMCPLCGEEYGCQYWYLVESCIFSKLSYLCDQPGTVFFSIFVSFWAVSFLEHWKKKSASLAHHWDCLDFEEEEERPRPQFAAKAPFVGRNPITGVKEPVFPEQVRMKRIAAGIGIILVMSILVLIFLVAIIIYRILISIPLFQNKTIGGSAPLVATTSGAFLNLIVIMMMGRVYEKLALKLTEWEMHRTQTDFENNLTFKVFIFQFVNYYSSIFYIAFFKGRFAGYPGHYTRILGLRSENCGTSGCFWELAQQLAIIMIGKQIVNNAQEILLPKLKIWWHKKQTKYGHDMYRSSWERDFQLVNYDGLFEEYLEMVLQFGFITIFVAAFPLAPLFALLNNWVEIRLDAQKFVCETRRPVAERAQNIGIWFKVLELLAHLAVISNAFLIAFTSQFLPRLLYQYEVNWDLKGFVNFTLAWAPNGTTTQACRYLDFRDENGVHTPFFWRLLALRLGFVIIFEHVVFSICRLIDVVVPDVPLGLEQKIKRERYLARQALADSDAILKVGQDKDEDEEEDDNEVDIKIPDSS